MYEASCAVVPHGVDYFYQINEISANLIIFFLASLTYVGVPSSDLDVFEFVRLKLKHFVKNGCLRKLIKITTFKFVYVKRKTVEENTLKAVKSEITKL